MKQWFKQLNVLNRKRPAGKPDGEDKAEERQGSTPKATAHGLPNTLVQADGGTSVDTRKAYSAGGSAGQQGGAEASTGASSDGTEADSDHEVKRLRMAGAI
jgi:hypothetical protein